MEEVDVREKEDAVREVVSLKRILVSVLRLKFSLYLVLIMKSLLPTIYSTVRISLLGEYPVLQIFSKSKSLMDMTDSCS